MKFNTLVHYSMTADYSTWEPEERPPENLTWRKYADPVSIKCLITVSPIGAVSLLTDQSLQTFAIVRNLVDAGGSPVMNEVWYSVQRVTPVYDSFGYVSSYRHTLAQLAPELLMQPIDPPATYPGIDQI